MTLEVPVFHPCDRRALAGAVRRRLEGPGRDLAARCGPDEARRAIVTVAIAAARDRSARLPPGLDGRSRRLLAGLHRDLAPLFARERSGDPDLNGFLVATAAEATLLPSERGAMGAVYTDAALARFTIRAGLRALGAPPRRVLDPACGAGAFLAEAALLLRDPAARLVGIDRDGAALQAAGARMALLAQGGRRARCALRAGDAFQRRLAPTFDLVVGNPPYVRQESMGGPRAKRALAARLDRALPGAAAALPARADLAVAFLLLGLASLRQGGVLAYVTTNAWLDALYGRPLRRFLAERTEVRLLAEWEGRVFPGAAANPVVVVVRRTGGPARRPAVFACYRRAERGAGEGGVPIWRAGRRRADPRRLASVDRWGATLLRGADLFEEILARAPRAFGPLAEIASLHYGTKPGLVDFFLLDADGTDVEDRFLLPVLTSTAEIGALAVRPQDLPRRLFVCPLGREELSRGEFPGALAHVLRGERSRTRRKARHTREGLPYPRVPSVRGNAPWYSLRPRPPADFAVPLLVRERHMIAYAEERLSATNMFYQGRFAERRLARPGAAILNGTISHMAIESLGRINIGGRINVYGPEIRALRVPDPRAMSPSGLRAIEAAFAPLAGRAVGPVSVEGRRRDRRALDVAILEAAGLQARFAPLLSEALEERVARRLGRERAWDHPAAAEGPRRSGPPLAGSAPLQ